MTDGLSAISAGFSRDAGWMALAINLGSLFAMPLALGTLDDLPTPLPVGATVLAAASFGVGAAFAGLFAFLGYLHYLWRSEAVTGGAGATAGRGRIRVSHGLGIAAGTLSYLAFLSGWIFLGEAVIRTAGWAW